MNFKYIPYPEIVNNLLSTTVKGQNFSKSIEFAFYPAYRLLMSKIGTVEFNADCILYSAQVSENETAEFEDEKFWCFSGSGQGDRWLMNSLGYIFFYDHQSPIELFAMDICFEQWVEMANIIGQLEVFLEKDEQNLDIESEFKNLLEDIHPGLSDSYPYTFFD